MVTVAASTEDAHRLLEGGARIDILIAAGNAPGFDVEFAENVKSRGITKRIIILTAEPDHLVGFHRNQMLAKPFKDYELLGMVDRYLRDDFLPPWNRDPFNRIRQWKREVWSVGPAPSWVWEMSR